MAKFVTTTISIPPELRYWLEIEAVKQTRSLSQQIVHMVNQTRERSQDDRKAIENA